jgi:hypothetical protein
MLRKQNGIWIFEDKRMIIKNEDEIKNISIKTIRNYVQFGGDVTNVDYLGLDLNIHSIKVFESNIGNDTHRIWMIKFHAMYNNKYRIEKKSLKEVKNPSKKELQKIINQYKKLK